MKKANLHIHTKYSDGLNTPIEILELAKKTGLSAISITDHDTVRAYQELKPNTSYFGVDLISGVEMSTIYKGHDIHILGYFIDVENKFLSSFLENRSLQRIDRIQKIIANLKKKNISLDYDEIQKKAFDNVSIGRPHVAEVLIEKGYVKNFSEAFEKYLGDECESYIPHDTVHPKEAIEMIKNASGLSVIAHPGRKMKESIFNEMISFGVQGVEVIHPSHRKKEMMYYQRKVQDYNLVETGGSDYHGKTIDDNKNFSQFAIDYNWVLDMKFRVGIYA